jgi:hypothetical protein
MSTQTHWKKLHNPDYLGAYALEPGKDLIATIKSVAVEKIIGSDGKKEECMVMRFIENIKPMIVNATNAKMIQKLYKTPYIEEWKNRKIQLFVDQVKAFGEVVEALRIRPFIPKAEKVSADCGECSAKIEAFGSMNAEQMAQYTYSKYGKPLCAECAKKNNDAGKVADVL